MIQWSLCFKDQIKRLPEHKRSVCLSVCTFKADRAIPRPHRPYSVNTAGRVVGSGCQDGHVLLSNAKIMNDWSYTSTTICLHGAHRENFSSSSSSNNSTSRLTICNARFEDYAPVLMRIQLKGSSKLNTRAMRSFERQENTNSAALRHLPDDVRHQQCICLVGAL